MADEYGAISHMSYAISLFITGTHGCNCRGDSCRHKREQGIGRYCEAERRRFHVDSQACRVARGRHSEGRCIQEAFPLSHQLQGPGVLHGIGARDRVPAFAGDNPGGENMDSGHVSADCASRIADCGWGITDYGLRMDVCSYVTATAGLK